MCVITFQPAPGKYKEIYCDNISQARKIWDRLNAHWKCRRP